MFDEGMSESLKQAEELNDKIDKAVDDRIDQLQKSIDAMQARLDQAKQSRFTWLISAGIAAALLSLSGFIALF